MMGNFEVSVRNEDYFDGLGNKHVWFPYDMGFIV
jgi:hypothetical protein